ncbi:MAG: hypothetical protein ACPF9D_05265 [Owenweeksia sp.]
MRHLILSFLLLMNSGLLWGQDSTQIANEILALARPFQQAEKWHLQQEIIMRDRASGEVLDREKTETYSAGAGQLSLQFSEEILAQEPYLVKVDNEAREIIVEPYAGSSATAFALEEYFEMYKELGFRETSSDRIYTLYLQPYYIYSKIQLHVSKENGEIKKLVIFPKYPMTVKGRERDIQLDIQYRKIDFNPAKAEEMVSAARYFKSKGSTLTLTSPYRDYKLINRLNP